MRTSWTALLFLVLLPDPAGAQPADTAWIGWARQRWTEEARRAKVRLERGRPFAIELARQAVLAKVAPEERLRLWHLDLSVGVGLYRARRWSEAARWLEALDRAYEPYVEPRDDLRWFAAEAWRRAGVLAEARRLYERLLAEPGSSYAAAAGFRLLALEPDTVGWPQRIALLARMPEGDSLTHRARLWLARWAMERGLFQEARALLPPGPEAHYLSAWAYELEGDTAAARREYERLLEGGWRARALWRIGLLEAQRGDSAAAMARWATLLRALSGPEAIELALQMGLPVRARILADNGLRELPEDPLDRAEALRDLAPALLAVLERVPLSPEQRANWLRALDDPGPVGALTALKLEAIRVLLEGGSERALLGRAPGYRFYRYAEEAHRAYRQRGSEAALAVWARALRDSLPADVRDVIAREAAALWAKSSPPEPESALRWARSVGLDPVAFLVQIAERTPDGAPFYQAALKEQPQHPEAPAIARRWIQHLQQLRQRLHPERQAAAWMEATTRLALLTEAFWKAYGPSGTHPASADEQVRAWAREALEAHIGYALLLVDVQRSPQEAARWAERAVYYTALMALRAEGSAQWPEVRRAVQHRLQRFEALTRSWGPWFAALERIEDPFPSPPIPLDAVPDSLRALIGEAIVVSEVPRPELARTLWAVAARAGLPRARYEAARWFYRFGSFDSAAAYAGPLPETAEGNLWQSSAWLLKGMAWLKLGRLDSAEAVLERFAQAYPEDPRASWALWELAQALSRSGLRERAALHWEGIARRAEGRSPAPLPPEAWAVRELLRYKLQELWQATEEASSAPPSSCEALYRQIQRLYAIAEASELEEARPLRWRAELRWAMYARSRLGRVYGPEQTQMLAERALRLAERDPELAPWARAVAAWLWVDLASRADRPADRAQWANQARALLAALPQADPALQAAIDRLSRAQ
ncbi:MAG: hypothetical protein RML47_04935 [Bacteroidota bacterium]|nr:hypothetical protein [Rhodothermia bacterium]MDW8285434.1 hypothetical protein [Bacteroidota bacterium]